MDPLSSSIISGIAAGLAKVGAEAVTDGYAKLKAIIQSKFGSGHALVGAIESLESKPDSEARKEVLQEEVAAAKADQDSDILAAARALLEEIKALPGGEQHIQHAVGNYIAQADRQSTATVHVSRQDQ